MAKKLKSQHANFCRLMAGGEMNQTVAYMECYPDSTYEASRDSASKLHANPDILLEIQRLRELTEEGDVMSRKYKREVLKKDVEDETIKHQDKHRAIALDSQMAGHNEPDEVTHNIVIKWGEA